MNWQNESIEDNTYENFKKKNLIHKYKVSNEKNLYVSAEQVEHYRTLFKALPEKAHIITYWATADTRIALVLNRDDADSKNDYYYVHAEPVQQ